MTKRIRNRLLVIVGVTALSIFLFAGFPPSVSKIKERVRLGLDLKGGTRLVLQVVTDDAIRAETDETIESLKAQLMQANVLFRQITRTEIDQFTAVGVDPSKDSDFQRLIADQHPEWDIISTGGEIRNTYTLRLKPQQAQTHRNQAVDQAINTIRNRVDQLGVTEPQITRYGGPGDYEILVQFPGVTDPIQVKNIIQKTAFLELKIVEGGGSYPSQAAALQQFGGSPPPDIEVLPSSSRGPDGSS